MVVVVELDEPLELFEPQPPETEPPMGPQPAFTLPLTFDPLELELLLVVVVVVVVVDVQ